MNTTLAVMGIPFVLLALGAVVLSVRLSPARLLVAIVAGASTDGSIFGLFYLAQSRSLVWLAILVWIVVFAAGSFVLAIRAERTGGSIASVVLSGAATGLVILGVYVFSHGWIEIIIGFGIILIGLLPAGLAYGTINTAGIPGMLRNAGVVAIAGIFGLSGFGMLNSGEIVVQGIGLLLCLVAVGLLALSFRGAIPKDLDNQIGTGR